MGRFCASSGLVCLLSLRAVWAAIEVTVPSSPIRARPGSDVQLPCFFSGSKSTGMGQLAVIWRVGSRNIAKYTNKLEVTRPGAVIAGEQVPLGNATLLLRGVQESDAAVYSCVIIHVPESDTGTVELRVEAPPRLRIVGTKLFLGQPSHVTCIASAFYPNNISVTWLRGGEVLNASQLRPAHANSEGLFSVESVLKITPRIADAEAIVSCQVRHQALERPLQEDFELEVLAPPNLQVFIVPEEKTFWAARCQVNGFYPKEIQVEWLRNNVPVPRQDVISQSDLNPNGTHAIQKVILLEDSKTEMNYACRVRHEALDDPLEQNVLWQPKSEGNDNTHPTLPNPPRTEKDCATQPPHHISIPAVPTDSSSTPGSCRSHFDKIGLLVVLSILGLLLGFIAGYLYSKIRGQSKAVPAEKTDTVSLMEKNQGNSGDYPKHQSLQTLGETRGERL